MLMTTLYQKSSSRKFVILCTKKHLFSSNYPTQHLQSSVSSPTHKKSKKGRGLVNKKEFIRGAKIQPNLHFCFTKIVENKLTSVVYFIKYVLQQHLSQYTKISNVNSNVQENSLLWVLEQCSFEKCSFHFFGILGVIQLFSIPNKLSSYQAPNQSKVLNRELGLD